MNNRSHLDPNFSVSRPDSTLVWYDAKQLTTAGQGWDSAETLRTWDRLPKRAESMVRPPVWELSRHSAGLEVRFQTDAAEIGACWTVLNPNLAMDHMPATGVSGLDLYLRQPGGWRWLAVGRPVNSPTNQVRLVAGIPAQGRRTYRLYLPLYNGIEDLQIGIPKEAVIAPDVAEERRVVVYGTSIVQGGCASRPGMAYPAQLGRALGVEMVNLGFSGNGQAEPELAELLADLPTTAFILDALPNLSAERVLERIPRFLEILRSRQPTTPILVVENITYHQQATLRPVDPDSEQKNAALRKVLGPMLASDPNVRFLPGASLLGEDGEGTVDGVHPTDLGFQRMAACLRPELGRMLAAIGNP